MTMQEKGLADCLFSGQDERLINIKFMRGSDAIIAPEAFQAEVCSAIAQRDAGLKAVGAVKSGKPLVNVRELVAGV